MSAVARTFILREEAHAQALWAFLRNNWRAMADAGKPLAVRAYEHKAKRSDEQRSLYWVWINQIAEQAFINGQRFEPDVWHHFMKEKFLPEETAAGKKKWLHLPSGERRLILGTGDLNVSEMSDYMNAVSAEAATELGVALV